jgi:hypothetical protein
MKNFLLFIIIIVSWKKSKIFRTHFLNLENKNSLYNLNSSGPSTCNNSLNLETYVQIPKRDNGRYMVLINLLLYPSFIFSYVHQLLHLFWGAFVLFNTVTGISKKDIIFWIFKHPSLWGCSSEWELDCHSRTLCWWVSNKVYQREKGWSPWPLPA